MDSFSTDGAILSIAHKKINLDKISKNHIKTTKHTFIK